MIFIEKYRIRRKDALQWVIEEEYYPKSGKNKGIQCWKNPQYFRKLEHLCDNLFEVIIDENGDANDIAELKKAVMIARNKICRVLQKVDIDKSMAM